MKRKGIRMVRAKDAKNAICPTVGGGQIALMITFSDFIFSLHILKFLLVFVSPKSHVHICN